MGRSELIACTLVDTDLEAQQERWLALARTFGLGHTETDDGIQLRFRYDPAAEQELRTLSTVENECCSWAVWDVERRMDVLVVTARSRGEGVTTLYAMLSKLT